MAILPDLRFRLRAIFRREALERELDEELRFHLEQEAEKYARTGLSQDEAMRQARLAFGGLEAIKEDARDARGIGWLDTVLRDLRYAVRGIRVAPGFAAAVVLTLGLGIGANAAMFGIIDRLMFRPAPYLHDPARVHRVYLASTWRGKDNVERGYQYTRYLDLARWTTSFSQLAAVAGRTLAVGTGEDAREMNVGAVSATFFGFFDARPALGRFFTEDEDRVPLGTQVAVLSHAFWQARYGGRPDVLGASIQIGPAVYTIIGVAPKGFIGVEDEAPPVAFVPITAYAGVFRSQDPSSYYTTYNWGWLDILTRRNPGVSLATATADLTAAYQRSWEAERALGANMAPLAVARPHAIAAPVQPLRGPLAGQDGQVIAWIGGVALIVLVIACANVANLLLGRALRRRREIAVRLALGVSRGRLLAQLLTESLLLAVLGGVAGLLLAEWGGRVLRAVFLPPGASAGVIGDRRTLVFAAVAALVTGTLAGLAPLLHAGRDDLATTLKSGVREGTYHRSRLRNLLLVFQATLSVVLLVGAGLFVRSLHNVRGMRLGYDVEPLLHVTGNPRGTVLTEEERAALSRRLAEEARTIPGVENAALALTLPFWDTWSQGLYVQGIDSVQRLGQFTLQAGSPEFFRTAGTRILRGRGITSDDRAGAPLVVVVSDAMARVLWPSRDAIGQCLRMNADTMPCITVVGIAENMRQSSLREDAQLHYYLPIEQFHPADASLYVRTRGDAAPYAETVRRRLQALMPGTSYLTVTPLSEIIGAQQRSWRMGATMFVAFGVLALVLAALGLYSVIAYDVTQRRHELGVRAALGARRGDLTRLVVKQGLVFVAAGIGLGGVIALVSGPWVAGLLFDESPYDPVVFGAVAAVLLIVALAATAIPAARAARVDPNIALRFE